MNITKLDDRLAVSDQISPSDLKQIAALGYRSIICNRPDREGLGQPSYAQIEAAANDAGLVARYIPVVPGQPMDGNVVAMVDALKELPSPTLAFCRSGARSQGLYAAAMSARV